MAEPLTSSDIIRERLGFGPTSPDEKRRAADAGISPLGTMDRIRFQEGRGISSMASKSDRDAWVAAEVMAGRRDPMELPKSYGGLGERPEATTRRQFRMQQEWDKRYEMLKEEQKVARDLEKYNQQYQLQLDQEQRMQRDQDMDLQAKLAESAREGKVQKEASLMMDAMKGAVAPDGKVIARPIRPEDDDAIERLNNLAGQFKYGIENKAVGSMFEMLYRDAMKFREDRMKQSEQNERLASSLAIQTGKPFEEFGTYDEQGMFQPRMQGMIAGEQQVKAGEEAKQEERVIRTEERRAEAAAGVSEKKGKESAQREIQRNIRKATEDLRKVNASLAGRKSLSDTQRANLTAAKDALIDLQIERAALDDMVFENANAYGAALREGRTFPTGTTIYIGRTPVKVK